MPDSTRPTPEASTPDASANAPSDEPSDKQPSAPSTSARLRLEVDILKGERDASENAPSASDPSARGALRTLVVLVLAALFGCAASAAHAQVIYVDADAGSGGDGSSWGSAYADLQGALAAATGADEIWIAEGTYYPTPLISIPTATDARIRFTITGAQDGLKIYGGFSGTETRRSQRDPGTHVTILSGDIGRDDESFDPYRANGSTIRDNLQTDHLIGINSYTVVHLDARSGAITNDTVLDGLTITAGAAGSISASEPEDEVGSGMYCNGTPSFECSPTLSRLVFAGNWGFGGGALGGGALFFSSEATSRPRILNTTFAHNASEDAPGSAIAAIGNDFFLTVINTTFLNNHRGAVSLVATHESGDQAMEATFVNATFHRNTTSPSFDLEGNPRDNGAALTLSAATPQGTISADITNSIIWGDTGGLSIQHGGTSSGAVTVTNSLVEDGLFGSRVQVGGGATLVDGGGNLAGGAGDDPRLTLTSSPVYPARLRAGSPAENRGTDAPFATGGPAADVTTDRAGATRIQNGTVDLGAFEGAGTRYYVRTDGADSNTGTNWTNAFATVTQALSVATGADDIWVAAGTYTPGTTREASFTITGAHNGVRIHGGFTGTEDALSERDLAGPETILSGDIGTPGDASDNSYHALVLDGQNNPIRSNTVLDGLTLAHGNADGSGNAAYGGGLLCNGVGGQCSPTLRALTFRANSASLGGGLCNLAAGGGDSSPTLVNTQFLGNTAEEGGALYNEFSFARRTEPVLINTTFAGNTASKGGAVLNNGGLFGDDRMTLSVVNSIFWDNTASSGAQVYNRGNATTTLRHTLVDGGPAGPGIRNDSGGLLVDDGGNLAGDDPQFVDASAGDLRLLPGSSALDAGDNTALPEGLVVDLRGAPRIQDDTVDLGAFEGAVLSLRAVVTKPTDSGPGSLREALQTTGSGTTITFDPVLDGQTIALSSGPLVLDKSVTIDASGLENGITISGGGAQRVFSVADGETVTLRALTIAEGSASSGAGLTNRGNLTLDGVTVTGNATTGNLGTGGGVRNRVGATLTLRNSTLSGNRAPGGDGNGGGIYNDGTVVLISSTLFGNSAGASGGGILNLGTLTLQSSVIAGSAGGDCVGGSVTESRSLVEDGSCGATLSGDPLLEALANNGGPAATHRPDAFSPLVDAGACNGLSADQRGQQRPVETNARPTAVDGCDIGAVELGASELPFRRYVDAEATGAGDGSSWTNAFNDLQDALAEADDNDQIWIAAGTYTPTEGTDRTVSFRVTGAQDGLRIYGGFAGTETRLDQRDLSASETVLSGGIGTPGDVSDNSYHVFVFDGTTGGPLTPATVLADVTLTGGNADGTSPSNRGGGLYCIGNGAGNACSPTLTRLVFADNRATAGGALYNFGEGGESSPQIIGSVFVNNQATAFGGAVLNNGNNGGTSSPVILSSTFARNASDTRGGALYNSGSSGTSTPTVTNSILYDNTAPDGPAVYNFSSSATLAHTLIEGGVNGAGVAGDANTDGGGTVDADPLLANVDVPEGPDGVFGTVDDGLRVQAGSPALDAGDATAFPNDPTTDLTGADRIQDGTVDLGAYEGPAGTATATETVAADGPVDFSGTNVSVTFADVSGSGTVTVQAASAAPADLGGLDPAFVPGYRLAIEVSGTLTFGPSTEIRVDLGLLGDIADPTEAVIYRRATIGSGAFSALPTTYDAVTNELVATTGTFSEFVVYNEPTPIPVELAAFDAQATGEAIDLTWETASEQNNAGFEIQRKTRGPSAQGGTWEALAFVEGAGTTAEPQTYRFRDAAPPFADALVYRLKQIDTDGTSELSPEVVVRRGPGPEVQLVAPFPNPVREQATVRYVVPEGAAQPVRLTVYNVLGQRVATLVSETQAPGREELRLDASRWASGMYFLRLHVGETMRTKRVTVVR